MKPTVVREPLAPIRHTGQFLVVSGCRPVVYRLPAASPVRPSIANGVTLSVVNEVLRGRRNSSSAHAAPNASAHSDTATVGSLMASPPLCGLLCRAPLVKIAAGDQRPHLAVGHV